MKVLIINQHEVQQLLPMDECMQAVRESLSTLAEGEAINPLRPVLWLPEKVGALGMMPAYLGNLGAMGIKVVSVFPGNEGTEYDSHQGAVMLFETGNGQLLALIDASEITAIRTAAATGVATDLLANPDARSLAILGSGVQARSHLRAMLAVRPFERVRVWSRHEVNARSFAVQASAQVESPIEVAKSARDAVEGADVICTVTSAEEPILEGRWLEEGLHVNAVGSSVPFTRELDTEAVVRSRLFVDRRESTLNEAGDFLFPKKEGAIDNDHILAEIGDILIGEHPGRESASEITLFKSLGIAVEDLAAAELVYRNALDQGIGTQVELGGERHVG